MTPPRETSKILLIADQRAGSEPAAGAPVRRYRIARLRLAAPADEARYAHLKRVYD